MHQLHNEYFFSTRYAKNTMRPNTWICQRIIVYHWSKHHKQAHGRMERCICGWLLASIGSFLGRCCKNPDGETISDAAGWYLFTEPRHFLYSHFPETLEWQLVDQPITLQDFSHQVIDLTSIVSIAPHLSD